MPRQRGITARRWAYQWVREFMLQMQAQMRIAHRYDLLRNFQRVRGRLFYQLLDAVFDMARNGDWLPDPHEQLYADLIDSQIDMLDQGHPYSSGLDPATPEISE